MSTRCPSCFVDLIGRFALRCTNHLCGKVVDPVTSRHVGRDVPGHRVMELGTPPPGYRGVPFANCATCGEPTGKQVCPGCHSDLPDGWRDCVTTCLVMAGARASGKSIYIAVLKRQAELLAEAMGGALTFFDAYTRETYLRAYQEPLYEQRQLVQATPAHHTPAAPQRQALIFRMGMVQGRQHLLVVRDVAGENLEDATVDPVTFSFFQGADAIAFLFDPTRIARVRQQLAGVIPDQQAIGGDPLLVLDNLIRILQGGAAVRSGKTSTPLAVVLAKFDALVELTKIEGGTALGALVDNPGAAFNRDPSLDEVEWDAADSDLLAAEVDSLLQRLDARSLLNTVTETFETSRLFAVSALGSAPATGSDVGARGIAPFRVLDPLKWAMTLSGALTSSAAT